MQTIIEIQDTNMKGLRFISDADKLPELLKAHKETCRNAVIKRDLIEQQIDCLLLAPQLRNKAVKAIRSYYITILKTVITE